MTAPTGTPTEIFAAYTRWLERQPFAANTRRTYRAQVAQFCVHLATSPSGAGDPLREQHAATYAVRDYRTWLKKVRKAKPSSVNLTLAALDHFYRFLGLDRPDVPREDLPQAAPRGLEEQEQIAFLRAVERVRSARDRALAHLLFYTGLRVGECAALNRDDITLSARKGVVIVRSGKGDTYREVPLNAEVRRSLEAYIKSRHPTVGDEPAFFLNRQGQRLSTRAIDLILRRLGRDAGVTLSAHTLRHTCLTALVRNGTDLVLVAEIAGHRRLETTRRYKSALGARSRTRHGRPPCGLLMPGDFLPDDRAHAYGRYVGEPSAVDLARIFHLDDADRAFIAERRGDQTKLGLAVQLTTVRSLGTFLEDPGAVPSSVVATLAGQLGIADVSCLERYRAAEARWDHAALIRQRYGYRDFADQPGYFRFVRWLYARAWTGAERPSALFDLAVARLVAGKVVLPGLTTLTRLIAQVRERATARLWRRLAALPSPTQRSALELLLHVADDHHRTPLDRLRRGPTHASSVTLVAALKRLEQVRALGVSTLDLTGIPPSRLRALARHAMVSRAQALSQMAPERRLATLLAFARTLEATATDDALSLFDLLLDDLLKGAARTGKKRRLATIRDLDAAALVLRDVARVVRDPRYHDADVRLTVTATHGEATIDAAIAVVDALARPPSDHYQQEVLDQYPTVRRFLPSLLRTLRFAGIAGARPLLEALDFLSALEGPRPPAVGNAPLTAIPNAWRDRVRAPGPGDLVDRKAYTCAVLEQTQAALRRHDLFVTPSEKWADPRTGLLRGRLPYRDALVARDPRPRLRVFRGECAAFLCPATSPGWVATATDPSALAVHECAWSDGTPGRFSLRAASRTIHG